MATADSAAPVFGALAEPTRRRVLDLLAERGESSATVLARDLPVTRQAVLKHLVVLGDAGLVRSRREGREVRYAVTPAPLSDAVVWMTSIGAEWDERLADLRRHLERPATRG